MGDMPALLEQSFGLSKDDALEVARDVVGYRLLPLENYLPHVSKQIEEWGGDVSKYPKKKIGKETATVEVILR